MNNHQLKERKIHHVLFATQILEIINNKKRLYIRYLNVGHLIPGTIWPNAVDNKGRHQCILGMAPYAESQLAATVETLFRSSPVSNRNNVWFLCSKVNTKGFCFHHQMPAELFSALLVCCYLSLAFPPQGKFCEGWLDWQLKNATVEWGASQPDADIISAAPYFTKKVESWISKARKQNGISDVFRAAVPLGLYLLLHPKGAPLG